MAQPPPRKGAYNKFVVNLHKEQAAKLQAKNQQELDLLDDIKNFTKQKAAIEKHYAEGLLKLSSVYGTKKIATISDIGAEGDTSVTSPGTESNIYTIWRRLLDENEKIAKARLAAVQVFQDNISEDAKNLRAGKNQHSKKSLDRLQSVQRDVQLSVAEVDRTKLIYYTEESDAIDISAKAEVADARSKGKKRDVISLFQSKSALKNKAGKLSAKQEESDIKSTGARNDYLLSLETANAHQDRYFHYELQSTVREMEGGIYEKMSHYLGTLARTELLTCSALHNSFTKIRDQAENIQREYNYRCYLKTYTCLGDHVQYAFEAVESDPVSTITPSEHDGGYSLNYEARSTAGKLNQAIRTIRAFKKRIKACQNHKSAGLKQEPNDPNGPNLDDKIEELELGIRTAETDKSKCEARLNKLREGGVSVDEYLDSISVATIDSDTAQKTHAPQDWGSSGNQSMAETPAAENGDDIQFEQQIEVQDDQDTQQENWANTGGNWNMQGQQQEVQVEGHNGEIGGWGQQASIEHPTDRDQGQVIDPNADIWKAIVLFNFQANNEDEITITENEQVDILVKECDEEGWVKVRNSAGQVGYAPTNYVEVFASETVGSASGPGAESEAGWAGAGGHMQTIPETVEWSHQGHIPGEALENSSDEEGGTEAETEDELPPGFSLPPPPPPQININPSNSLLSGRPVSIQFGNSLDSEYCKGLYDYTANGKDELSFREDDVIHIVSRSPNQTDDGWWMGELNGKTGLFPSIVVEECQANGDDWSPDVSMTECSETEDDMPPCFGAPPSLPNPPPPPPPVGAPPPSVPPPPVVSAPPPRPPPSVSQSSPTIQSLEKTLEPPSMQIKITNPTPTVETIQEPPVSYHVEDSSFSMQMSPDKAEHYQSCVPVEVNVVTVEPPKELPSKIQIESPEEQLVEPHQKKVTVDEHRDSLVTVQCVVTAPTPRSQTPEDQGKLFPLTSCSETEDEGSGIPLETTGWTDVESHPIELETSGKGGWADFPDPDKKQESSEGEGWAAFGHSDSNTVKQETKNKLEEIPNEICVEREKPIPKVSTPTLVPQSVPSNILSDLADSSDDEEINTTLQKPTEDTLVAESSTDSESETVPETEDDRKRPDDSSETESEDEPEDTSRDETPAPPLKSSDMKLPPEDLEPRQLKKLETMKESPA